MPARGSSSPWKFTADWGDDYAGQLWDSVLEPAELAWAGATVLDLGCHWGYVLKHLLEARGIREGHGVDIEAHWIDMEDGSDPTLIPGLHLHQGRLGEIAALDDACFDVAVTMGTIFLMRPTELHRALAWIYDHLRPGGHLLVNTRTYFAHNGADLDGVLSTPLAHLLFTPHEVDAHLAARALRPARYMNPSSATTYLMQFRRVGFELRDVRRQASRIDPEILERFADKLEIYDREELLTGMITAYLRRPDSEALELPRGDVQRG